MDSRKENIKLFNKKEKPEHIFSTYTMVNGC